MAPDLRRPFPLGPRGFVLAGLGVAGIWAALYLGLQPSDLTPSTGGLSLARDFFARAFSPALSSEAAYVPDGTPGLLALSLRAAVTTVVYAAAAMSVALVLGIVLGFCASTAWWSGDPLGGRTWFGRTVAPVIYGATRVLIGFMRSVHEVLWAVLFLAAVGLTPLAAVVAIAIPYAGTLAKIFSEMVDEAPREASHALRAAGASGMQQFAFGLVPRALPDMIAYAFYRFECALRSSAVLGFFGYETLGREIEQSFVSTNYGEVWTHLYVLLALVLVFDAWSGRLRARLAR
ncbi:MAG: ABC transporter permease subunit [Planctomycetota bacterium]|nr:ABC transporter permease subunit [Planctomycetota bacterium]